MDMTPAELKTAVRDGIVEAMTDARVIEKFWKQGFDVLTDVAADGAGHAVLGWIKKGIGIGAIVLVAWVLAGSTVAKAVLAALTKG